MYDKNHHKKGKLDVRWRSYYVVVEKTGPVSYRIKHQLTGSVTKAHTEHLRAASIEEWEITTTDTEDRVGCSRRFQRFWQWFRSGKSRLPSAQVKRMFILPHGTWKDTIRYINLDWRQRPIGHSSRPVSFTCVFSGCRTTSQKGSPPQKKDICELSLTVFLLYTIIAVEEWKYKLYFYISTSPSLFVQWFNIRGAYDKFPDFFSYGHLKLS